MKLSFIRKPAFHGEIHTWLGISVQFYEKRDYSTDYIKVTSDSPRQVIHIPVSLITKALEDQWVRDSSERAERQAQQFQNKPSDG